MNQIQYVTDIISVLIISLSFFSIICLNNYMHRDGSIPDVLILSHYLKNIKILAYISYLYLLILIIVIFILYFVIPNSDTDTDNFNQLFSINNILLLVFPFMVKLRNIRLIEPLHLETGSKSDLFISFGKSCIFAFIPIIIEVIIILTNKTLLNIQESYLIIIKSIDYVIIWFIGLYVTLNYEHYPRYFLLLAATTYYMILDIAYSIVYNYNINVSTVIYIVLRFSWLFYPLIILNQYMVETKNFRIYMNKKSSMFIDEVLLIRANDDILIYDNVRVELELVDPILASDYLSIEKMHSILLCKNSYDSSYFVRYYGFTVIGNKKYWVVEHSLYTLDEYCKTNKLNIITAMLFIVDCTNAIKYFHSLDPTNIYKTLNINSFYISTNGKKIKLKNIIKNDDNFIPITDCALVAPELYSIALKTQALDIFLLANVYYDILHSNKSIIIPDSIDLLMMQMWSSDPSLRPSIIEVSTDIDVMCKLKLNKILEPSDYNITLLKTFLGYTLVEILLGTSLRKITNTSNTSITSITPVTSETSESSSFIANNNMEAIKICNTLFDNHIIKHVCDLPYVKLDIDDDNSISESSGSSISESDNIDELRLGFNIKKYYTISKNIDGDESDFDDTISNHTAWSNIMRYSTDFDFVDESVRNNEPYKFMKKYSFNRNEF